MKSYRYLHLDVFTDRIFSGNQLAVFLDGRGLDPQTMQSIAREMNFAESTFVLPPERPGMDLRLRIFTPDSELPMAGHPTIGTTFALAAAGVLRADRDRIVMGLGVGPIDVSLTWVEEDLTFAWMTQLAPTFGKPIADPAGAAGALRLPAAAVGATGLPVQVVSCGVPFVFVPIASRAAVDSASLDPAAYEAFVRAHGISEHPVFLFTTEAGNDKATAYSRMFAPELGVIEDPATGGASGPLGCYLVRHRVVTTDSARAMLSLQGVAMKRPSHIHISIGVDDGDITSVRVGGEAVLAGEGTLYL